MIIRDKQNNPAIGNKNNIAQICTLQQCDSGKGNRTAVRWISSDLTRTDYSYFDLERESNKVANVLTSLHITPGDKLFTYLIRTPDLYPIFLGVLKRQAIACVLFGSFGEEALLDRLSDSQPRILFTHRKALKKINTIWKDLANLEKIILVDIDEDISDKVISYRGLMLHASEDYITPFTDDSTASVLHYTSGSTGKPKGVLHAHKSIASQMATSKEILNLGDNDIYWCTADPGWVTGVSYGIIGPMSLGVTQVQYAGNYDPEVWMKILQEENVSVWYTAPTALRMLMQADDSLFKRYDLSKLKYIFSVGEPLNPHIIAWCRRVLGKEVFDTWFQTETGAIMIANRPGLAIKMGSMGKPCTQVDAVILNNKGIQTKALEHGNLCLKQGWPSMFISYLNRESEYRKKFRNRYYWTGDVAYRDEDGYFWFVGRSDDVINTAGHLVGPFEVESALLEMKEIAEAGVIGVPDELLFEKVVAFIKLRSNYQWSRELELKIRIYITNKISSYACPHEFKLTEAIPKNKSGKIMRRVLKASYFGLDAGDLSTLEET